MSKQQKRGNQQYHAFMDVESMAYEFDPDQTLNVDMTSALASLKQKGFQGSQRSLSQMRSTSATSTSSKNRARAKKAHEIEPFLTIDVASKNKPPHQGVKYSTTPVYDDEYFHNVDLANSDKLPKQPSPAMTRNTRLRQTRSCGVSRSHSPAAKLTRGGPQTQPPSKINHHVKMPFKHGGYKSPVLQGRVCAPSQGLKERTAFATQQVNKILSQQKHQTAKKNKGKLLVGKLKPLYPVHQEGPSIKYCRGIVADTRSYSASPSRTLQRQRRLICNIKNMNTNRRMTEPELRDALHLMSPDFDENAQLMYERSGAGTPQDDVYEIERPLSLISISPLSYDQESSGPPVSKTPSPDLITPTPSPVAVKSKPFSPIEDKDSKRVPDTTNRKKEEEATLDKDVKPDVKNQEGMQAALTKSSKNLNVAIDDLQQDLFPSFEDAVFRDIEVVARAQNVNNSNSAEPVYDEPCTGVKHPVDSIEVSKDKKPKEFIFITEADRSETSSDIQRSVKTAESGESVKSRGHLESAGSSDQQPLTTMSSGQRVSSSKSVRFVDEENKMATSGDGTGGSHVPSKPQLKPSRTTCKPNKVYGKTNSHDGDDDKENIPKKALSSGVHVEVNSTQVKSDSSSVTNSDSKMIQGNADNLDPPLTDSVTQVMLGNADGVDQTLGLQMMLETTDKLKQPETSQVLNMSNSASSDTFENGQVKVGDSQIGSKGCILSQLHLKEMEPLVIELAESKVLDEGINSYNVSECSTVLGVLEKYPDLCKYLKVENISARGVKLSTNSSEAVSTEVERSGSSQAFKITFSTYEPETTDRPSSAENKSLQNQSTETEDIFKPMRKRKKRKVKVSSQATKVNQTCSSNSGVQHSYEASTRQNFPSDILAQASDDNSVPKRSLSPSCQVPVSSRRQRPSSASSNKSHPCSLSFTRTRPSSACPTKSNPCRASFKKSRPSSAPSYANRRSLNEYVTTGSYRVTQTCPVFLRNHGLLEQKTNTSHSSMSHLDETLDLTDALSFNELEKQINVIQSELKRNIDEHTHLLSTTEKLRETLNISTSPTPVDDADISGNSDLDSAVCEESPALNGSVKLDDANLESDDDYGNLLLSYRKMCMDISEGSVRNGQCTTPNNTSARARKDTADQKSVSEVLDSGCESETIPEAFCVDDPGEVTGKEKLNLLEEICNTLPEQKTESGLITKNGCTIPELEVIATTKKLSKARVKPKCLKPSAPFPPLCFSVNARPPPGSLYYFSYGTDMNINRISNYLSRKVENRFWGLLFGFSLVFNKKGFDMEAGGFPNIEFSPSGSVEGCVYQLTPKDVQILDKCIGYPEHYEHVMIPVWMSNCRDPDGLGVAQYCVPALTYIAQDKWIDNNLKPCDFAVSQCLKSSDLLTPQYKEHLLKMSGPPQTVEASV